MFAKELTAFFGKKLVFDNLLSRVCWCCFGWVGRDKCLYRSEGDFFFFFNLLLNFFSLFHFLIFFFINYDFVFRACFLVDFGELQ